jgi:hypothetical protein
MEAFNVYTQLGWQHILDLGGYDHILFIAALAGIYNTSQWQKLLLLITAFTLGHSLTLLLTTLQLIYLPSELIEFLIPTSIAITCIGNWFAIPKRPQDKEPNFLLRYIIAFFFGLIHGMGFSNYLIQLLGSVDELWIKILAFNVGLEIGQIVVVVSITTATFLLLFFSNLKQRDWNLVTSSIILGLALVMVVDNGKVLQAKYEAGNLAWQRPVLEKSKSFPIAIPFSDTLKQRNGTDTTVSLDVLPKANNPVDSIPSKF